MAELLSIPIKKSTDVDIVKPLKNVIQSVYSATDNIEDYTDALNELNRLRTNAIWKVFDKSALEVIYCYYDQLVSLEKKIPPQEVQIPFKWKDAFDKGSIFGGRISLTISSLAYERMCILFNMAAMQSTLAAQEPLDTEESLKQAAKLFQQAAGILTHLKANIMLAVHQETTPDLAPDTLHALAQLMLAQAQEVIALKCMRDEMKEGMVARVCSQAEELYTDALRSLSKDAQKQLWDREWIPLVTAKQAAFGGLAQLYAAAAAGTAGAVGEKVARLRLATARLKSATGSSRALWLQEPLARAERQLASAIKDNDFIYHDRVPDPTQLEPVPRAPVAKPLPLQDRWSPPGKDLFAGLVGAAQAAALAARLARRTDAAQAHIARLRDGTQLLNSILASLNLPACVENCGGDLPDSIRRKAATVRDAGGLPALDQLMAELPELLQRNRDILDESDRMLNEERDADTALREQFGARWTRTPSDKLTEAFRANAAKYRTIIDNAVRADHIVRQKYDQHRQHMELLARPEADIAAGLPAGGSGADGTAAAELRRLVRDTEALTAARADLEKELQELPGRLRTQEASGAAEGTDSEEEPAPLSEARRRAEDSLRRQEALVAEIQKAHAELMEARGGASGRDAVLGALAAAHDAYQELSGNLREGIKFYNDLTQLLVAFQNKLSDYCYARRTEKEELLKDLTQDAARMAPARPAPTPPAAAAEQPVAAKREVPPRPPPPVAAATSTAPSTLPYPAQPQGMPLPYGAGAPYPYYAPPPMPAMYNPYATLPYPRSMPAQPYQPYQYPPPPAGYPQPPAPGYNPYGQQ